jgi:hypothetical protein
MSCRAGENGLFVSRDLNDVPILVELALQFDSYEDDASEFARQNTWGARFDGAGLFS